MDLESLDTTPLSRTPDRARWRRFRAEAVAGTHGADLAGARWWRQWAYPAAAVMVVVSMAAMPVALLAAEGAGVRSVTWSALWCGGVAVVAVTLLGWQRHEFWGPRARGRLRLVEFARRNGLRYEPEASVPRPAAHIFGSARRRRHLDRVEVPGPCGFVLASYEETWDDGIGESWGYDAGYAVFRLRESYPRTLVGRAMPVRVKALQDVEPIDGPAGTRIWSTKAAYPLLGRLLESGVVDRVLELGRSSQVEIVGDELFVLRGGGHWPTGSPRLWTRMEAIAQALAPFLGPAAADPDDSRALLLRRPATGPR
ncbi:hypothetical protein RB608_11600 [Nocardioides sp. LHD-245]|uniref:hypothetical protein n=1 Tax=Nocardioides sp. LHD-245 TaxID=3051387 RepID=UPI0027E00ED5|nr:hypothetical protein [Nocardioides sp. LHD-245]